MSTQICRGFTDTQWRWLRERLVLNSTVQNDESAWGCAAKVFERRMTERFLSCIDALQKADSRADVYVPIGAPADCSALPDDPEGNTVVPGFAMMALCCLLIETLSSFRESPTPLEQAGGPCPYPNGNCIRPQPAGGNLIREFLQRPSFNGTFADPDVARDFVRGIRDGILHEAETRRWTISRDRPAARIVGREGKRYRLNRTAFYRALLQEFRAYLGDLGDPRQVQLRTRFVKKMDDIVKAC